MADSIYANAEEFNLQEISSAQPDTQTAMWTKERNPNTGPPPLPSGPPAGAADRCCRWTAVCLGLLCVLLLGLSIGLTAWILTERHQLLTNNTNLLKERDQLLTNHSNLVKERDQLLTNHSNLLKERERLRCPSQWEFFESNCYHNKAHGMSWSDSRRYCASLGGDLVLIKTPEKQQFITKMEYGGWIGLRKGEKNRMWTWLDNSPVSTWYWHAGEPNSDFGDCVVIHEWGTTNNTWYDDPCDRKNWPLCEKPAFTQN